jgi:metal-responsive CopG/Arc/MetJ family transcriptional regulator
MTMIKTAISLSDIIYEEMNALARRLDIPRSQLFALAAEEFLQRHKNKDMVRKINEALNNQLNREDKKRMSVVKRKHRQLVEGQW